MTAEQNPRQSATAERERRHGWVVNRDSGEVLEVEAFFCDNPGDPDREFPYWWVPDYGYSIPEVSLHGHQINAAYEALKLARQQREQAAIRVERYEILVRALGGSPDA